MKASAIDDLVDAGPIVGLLSETAPWHASSHSVLTVLDVQLATTALVWGEISHRPRKDRVALFAAIEALETGRIVLLPFGVTFRESEFSSRNIPRWTPAMPRWGVLSELHPQAKIIPTDAPDFTVYRRFRHAARPLIHP